MGNNLMNCKHDNYTKKKDVVKCKDCGISGALLPDSSIIWDDYSCSHCGEPKLLKNGDNYCVYGKGRWIDTTCLSKPDGLHILLIGAGNGNEQGYVGLISGLNCKDELVGYLKDCLGR